MSESSSAAVSPAPRRIVVGTDGSLGARAAQVWAGVEALRRGCELVLVYVPHVDARIVAKLGAPLIQAVDEFGRNLLDQAADDAAGAGVTVRTVLGEGAPADVLVAFSADADLVVVGSRGSDEVTGTMIGSVSHRVATHANCPVAIVPASTAAATGTEPVVAGVSGSTAGRHAAGVAAKEADSRGVPLRLVFACAEPSDEMVRGDPGTPAMAQIADELREQYPGLQIDVATLDGEPVDVLLEASRTAQLLVLGCHRSLDRWSTRLGSVPSQLLHRVSCPVVLVGS